MCGIAGIWSKHLNDSNQIALHKMTDSLVHRGPDGEGHWTSDDKHVFLGHKRLAIIDLTEDGKQPMSFLDRYTITFNGEIYNYIEIKEILKQKGYAFQSNTDTEVLLKAYHEWGKECLQKFDGMFAFAIYDALKNELFCARDRFGEKPFYYAFQEGNFVFASEMKALWSYGIKKQINNAMVYNFLVHDLVENPNDQRDTFYDSICKLKSSHYISYKGEGKVDQIRYWDIDTSVRKKPEVKATALEFLELLTTSVERRLRADVPVGTSLSGGLDSSSIVALVSQLSTNNHTFSARFKDSPKDEGKYINTVSKHFKTIHHDVFVNEEMFIKNFHNLCFHQEEPFQTGSIFAQYCVYEEARKNNILVMLDGQGADEFLCGYEKDFDVFLKQIYFYSSFFNATRKDIFENHSHQSNLSIQHALLHKIPNSKRFLRTVKNTIHSPVPQGITNKFHKEFSKKESPFYEFKSLKETLKHEMLNQGLEKLLKFADRNSMAHSLEVRLPFLSHELVEFVFQLDESFLLQDGWSKAILRTAMQDILPNEIVRRKDKIGFEAPHQTWMKNKLMEELYYNAKNKLLDEQIITSDFHNSWKVMILNAFL